MGNHSSHKHKETVKEDAVDNDTGVLVNVPYLMRMFEKLSEQSRKEHPALGDDVIARTVFEATFNGPLNTYGKLLFNQACNYNQDASTVSKKEFLTSANKVLSVLNESQQIPYYFKLFTQGKDHLNQQDVELMVHICYAVALASAFVPYKKDDKDEEILAALGQSILGKKSQINADDFIDWCSSHCEGFFSGVHSWLTCKLAATNVFREEDEHYVPVLEDIMSHSSSITLAMLWLMSCTLPTCYRTSNMPSRGSSHELGSYLSPAFSPVVASKLMLLTRHYSWHMLYNSNEQGLSVNRFEHHVFSYNGPTVTLVCCGENSVYCAAVDSEWRDNGQRWGSANSTIIQLLPTYAVVDTGANMFYMNHLKRGMPKGIQIGTNVKSPVLHIDDDLTNVMEKGVQSRLKSIEVWGTAGTDIKDAQVRQKQWETREANRQQQRKLKFDGWDDNPDRMLLQWGGVTTSHAQK